MKKFTQKLLPIFITLLMGLALLPSTFNPEVAYATTPLLAAPVSAAGETSSVPRASVPQSVPQTPVSTFADGAAILKDCYAQGQNSQNGQGIICVIKLVINILSVLVGIVGIIGIVVVGIQYLTAGGNEEQTRKAKRRLFEIIIGIVAYVLLASFLNWLLPEFNTSRDATSYLRPVVAIYLGA